MGYVRSALRLEWPEESEFSGLVVRMKRISIGQLVAIESLQDLRKSDDSKETAAALAELLDAVGEGLLGWNLEDEVQLEVDGNMVVTGKVPVPATRESLDTVDLDLILAIVKAWTKAAASVPLVSQPNSPSGEPPDELGNWLAWEQQNQPASPEPVSS